MLILMVNYGKRGFRRYLVDILIFFKSKNYILITYKGVIFASTNSDFT